MPATKKAKTPIKPMFMVREKWLKDLKGLKFNKFFTVDTVILAQKLREMISRLKKSESSFKNKNFTVFRRKQEVGERVKAPVFECWRTK